MQKRISLRRSCALALGLLLVAGSATAYTITLYPSPTTGTLVVRAVDRLGGTFDQERRQPLSLPYFETVTNEASGAVATSHFALSDERFEFFGEASLPDSTPDEHRGAYNIGIIAFESDEDLYYDIGGSFTADSPDGHFMWLNAQLVDLTLDTQRYRSLHESISTPDESLMIGVPGGDRVDIIEGEASGMLLAGHEYAFQYHMELLTCCFTPQAYTAATASGSVYIDFTPVPEPSTALLVALGCGGLGLRSRRQQGPNERKGRGASSACSPAMRARKRRGS